MKVLIALILTFTILALTASVALAGKPEWPCAIGEGTMCAGF